MVKTVVLCGCGNIGFRHFQALMNVQDPLMQVFVIDPEPKASERVDQEIADMGGTPHRVVSKATFDQLPDPIDLGIIATNAPARRGVFDALIEGRFVNMVLFEKVLFQNHENLDAVGHALKHKNMAGFVNCGRRGFTSYRQLRETLVDQGPLEIEIIGQAFGMASNSIHFLDLAEFLTGARLEKVDASRLEPGYHQSKRNGQIEIFGEISAGLSDGSSLRIVCNRGDAVEVGITISGKASVLNIDENMGTIKQNGQLSPFAIERVSGMSHLYRDALLLENPGLTPYDDSARQHRLFLNALRPHLGLSNTADDLCPIS